MSYTLQFDHLVLKPNLIDMTTPMCIHYIIEELYSKNENFRTRRIKISVEYVYGQTPSLIRVSNLRPSNSFLI